MLAFATYNTYGFRLKGDHQERVAGLHSIGKETRTEHSYVWNGLERKEVGRIVFQYTLNGHGAIRVGDHTYTLSKGDAFFVEIPSDHCYYLPPDSEKWEFIFITVYGEEAHRCFQSMTANYGHIFHWPNHSRPIKHILRLIEIIETTGIHHGYEASGYAYQFLMECMQYLEYDQQKEGHLPVAVAKAMTFMKENYANDIGLDDIVTISGLSKYHFTRLFAKSLKDTPMQFLTKIRIEEGIYLLQHTNHSIADIANKVGFSSSNYFSKVFKSILNETPTKYRQNKSVMPVDRLFID
ncbi:AraC family transcriptional regulator [Gracilibacillus halophilus YIM-C55.5]|uniref:AraC family transcriptional regulator n=1 Tax=Gracilibacillus halophilus YIM-C55.5 TaxID=1308866 RepID=N4WBV0_9BACI|nr:AraC family transcriptional regulator [Gracilibacillus halophilus]ENH97778.1 AraC family transcriptional regulator [Gracilibacillus halophilus YIM-C55.5]